MAPMTLATDDFRLGANADTTGQTGDSYCQITDVETEEDGLISYDRAVWKVDPAPIRAAARGEGIAVSVTSLVPTAAVKPTVWRYTTARPAADWSAPGFDASAWKDGQSAFGGGYDNTHTPWTDTPGDIWLRREFPLAAKPKAPLIRMIHDEGVGLDPQFGFLHVLRPGRPSLALDLVEEFRACLAIAASPESIYAHLPALAVTLRQPVPQVRRLRLGVCRARQG